MRVAVRFACAVLLLAATSPALAKNDRATGERPHGSGGRMAAHFEAENTHQVRFSNSENSLVRVYFAQNQVVWMGLPPGVAKNFARGKRLPPGIAKKALPPDLLAHLPRRQGYDYARIGQDVVLIEKGTNLVVDMIQNVFG